MSRVVAAYAATIALMGVLALLWLGLIARPACW
jgi:hypothetical protein